MKLAGKFFAAIALFANVGATLLADDDGQGRRIELPVPIGHDVKGLRLPIRNDQGKVEMMFDMESARRLDEQNIEMHTVTIQTYNQQTFKPDAKIDLQSSTMNLDTEVITTKEPVRITRDDFVLTAESGEFNSKTRQGAVYGNIHLVIYNRNEFQTKSPSEGQQQLSQ
jgi:Lipopolysaccharide-assembly, LptC-related